jgi:hypothetical protein
LFVAWLRVLKTFAIRACADSCDEPLSPHPNRDSPSVVATRLAASTHPTRQRLSFVIFEPCNPMPAIKPVWLKMNA